MLEPFLVYPTLQKGATYISEDGAVLSGTQLKVLLPHARARQSLKVIFFTTYVFNPPGAS